MVNELNSLQAAPPRRPVDARENRLLAALPPATWARWRARVEPVWMSAGEVIYDLGADPQAVYFPVDAVVSILQVLADGGATQIAMVGREGLVGIANFMCGRPAGHRAVVQTSGSALRLDAKLVRTEFENSGAVMRLLLCYTQAIMAQMSQTAVCNRHHTPEQQLCRFLLTSLDRISGDEVVCTHEQVATMLGVRRETVTDAVGKLQAAQLIKSRRGHIAVIDRAGLEHRACECYRVVKREYDALLPIGV
jgi:CRP-like cAMP-binding protein